MKYSHYVKTVPNYTPGKTFEEAKHTAKNHTCKKQSKTHMQKAWQNTQSYDYITSKM